MATETLPPVVLTTARLVLRPFTAADAPDVHEAWQDDAYVRNAPVGYAFAGADLPTAVGWCTTGIEQRRADGRGIGFAVQPAGGGRLAGHVQLFGLDWTARVAEMHYWTSPWSRGHGYAAESARAVARWALTEARLERVFLHVDTANKPSLRVAEAGGFAFEGVQRNLVPNRAGTRSDMAVFSLIPADLS